MRVRVFKRNANGEIDLLPPILSIVSSSPTAAPPAPTVIPINVPILMTASTPAPAPTSASTSASTAPTTVRTVVVACVFIVITTVVVPTAITPLVLLIVETLPSRFGSVLPRTAVVRWMRSPRVCGLRVWRVMMITWIVRCPG